MFIVNPFNIRPPAQAFGELLNDSFNRSSLGSEWVTLGGTFSTDGSDLNISGGTGTFLNRIRWAGASNDKGHSFENCYMEARVQLNSTPSATTYGISLAFGDFHDPDGRRDVHGQLYMTTSGTIGGKALIQTYGGGALQASWTNALVAQSAGSLTRNSGEWYLMRLTRAIVGNKNNYTMYAKRELDNSEVTATWDEPLIYPQTSFGNSTGQFAIHSIGGNIKVDYFKVVVNDLKYIHDLFVGDSITHGAYATNLSTRFAASVSDSYQVSAGSGDGTKPVLDKIVNLISYNPVRVFLMIGGNDILNGVASGTYQANYTSIVTQLKAAGIQVIHLLATPRTPTNITALNTWIQSTFTSDVIVDTFTPLLGSGTSLNATYDCGDGVHPNQSGHTLIASTIVAAVAPH